MMAARLPAETPERVSRETEANLENLIKKGKSK